MKHAIFSAGLLLAMLGATPSAGQVIAPTITPPPCTGPRCLNPQRGATAAGHPAPAGQRPACPQGTFYDAHKGTCHVVP